MLPARLSLLRTGQRLLVRSYAMEKGGSKAKGGQAKTAIKSSSGPKAEMPALPFFIPKPKTEPLPDATFIRPEDVDLNVSPTWMRKPETLLRSIDLDMRKRLDHDDRFEMFSSVNPAKRIPIGSAVVVEFVSSRTQPRLQSFAGILLETKHSGITTNFTLRHSILKTGVEMKFPVFSPLITKIKVLKRAVRKDGKGDFENLSVKEIRENPKTLPIGYQRIDEMASRERENHKRLNLHTESASDE